MDPIKRVENFLHEYDPELEVIVLEENTATAPLAARALGTEVGQIAKSILFKTKKDEYLMVVSAGDVRLDSKRIKEAVGQRVRMARAEEVEEVTGYKPGGVCPFDLSEEIDVYLDDSLKKYGLVYAAAGTANTALPIAYEQLREITGGKPGNFSE